MKQQQKQVRLAVLDYDKCSPQKCGGWLCIRKCPVNLTGKDCILKDEKNELKPLISESLCTGCGICPKVCPFGAITIVNLTANVSEPIHQYNQNSFRLFGLPVPKPNSVVGLIGMNGIGKTTALQVLTGHLIPNLGVFSSEVTGYDSLISFFKGKELQGFFDKLSKKELVFSFKPQNVDELPNFFKGTVKEMLLTFGDESKVLDFAEKLELTEILNHNLSNVSGGELQRIAITAALLKDADFYFFDEPSSYLDVRQRLKTAKLIRDLAENKQKSVMVVEHDLSVLDYLSDYIHVLFGEKSVYGVVSSTKSVANGINEYLEGFLVSENIRTRSKSLKFDIRPPSDSQKENVLAEYPALEKNLGTFSLKSEAGKFMKGEVLGVLGPNAIGKTTFVKMLANVIKPDNTGLDFSLKVSYKPQYIKADESLTVSELFASTIHEKELFETEIDRKLNVSKLWEKKLSSLSGGELQKVAISLALCREANLVLLDEPSAFLDVEDRLKVADVIRGVSELTGKTTIVVDHDILFQDYVSDRVIVFDGIPSKSGKALKPMALEEGMNTFLKSLGVTYRRDPRTGRPRANKENSVKDQEQKKSGKYYYS